MILLENGTLIEYINTNMLKCVAVNKEDNDTLIGLPYPYTVPAVGHFDELYYWDTYFTNKGLEELGDYTQVKYNTDDMLFLVEKYGFMPNGNRTYYLSRSQPPFLSQMVRDVYEHSEDKEWLLSAYEILLKEYDFWMNKRISPVGLNVYGGDVDKNNFAGKVQHFENRTKTQWPEEPYDIARHCAICCESGWDMNPRWGREGFNYLPVDLNSLMYMFEKNMEFFSAVLGLGKEEFWMSAAKRRKELMMKYMCADDGVLYDYNFVSKQRSTMLTAASLYPLFANMLTEDEVARSIPKLMSLEAEYGILTCEDNVEIGTYQWNYPNGWPCLQYIAVVGFKNYGYQEDAKRIALKYVTLVENVFKETGNLWEKYNVVEGNTEVCSEDYRMPVMMGWTAGTYLSLKNMI